MQSDIGAIQVQQPRGRIIFLHEKLNAVILRQRHSIQQYGMTYCAMI